MAQETSVEILQVIPQPAPVPDYVVAPTHTTLVFRADTRLGPASANG